MASRTTRKGKGRQKTKMEKIENESNLQVTFSKRRNGLFKKALELSIMTEAELAIIVYSPGGKVYSFAHPSLEIVTHKFLTENPQPMSNMQQLIQDQRDKHVTEMITELNTIENNLDAEIKRGKDLDSTLARSQNQYWGASDKNDCQNLPQLKKFAAALLNLKANVKREIGARALVELKNYDAPTDDDNNLRPLMGLNYNVVRRGNGFPTLRECNLYQVSEGSGNVSGGSKGSSFTNGHSFFSGHGLPHFPALNVHEGNSGVYRGGGNWSMDNGPGSSTSRGFLPFTGLNEYEGKKDINGSGDVYRSGGNWSMNNGPGSSTSRGFLPFTGLNEHEGNKGINGSGGVYHGDGNWSQNNEPSLFTSRGLPALSELNVSECDDSGSSRGVYYGSGGKSIHNGNSSFTRRYLPYNRRLNINEGGQVNSGGGSFYGGASRWLFNAGDGRGLPNTNGASSFGVANNDGRAIDGVPELDGSMPSHGFGVDFRHL